MKQIQYTLADGTTGMFKAERILVRELDSGLCSIYAANSAEEYNQSCFCGFATSVMVYKTSEVEKSS